jgi:hypothetical protein
VLCAECDALAFVMASSIAATSASSIDDVAADGTASSIPTSPSSASEATIDAQYGEPVTVQRSTRSCIIASNLQRAQKDAVRVRCRVSGPPLVLGVLLLGVAVALMIVNLSIFSPALFCISVLSASGGASLQLLALLPSDRLAVRGMALTWCIASVSVCVVFAWIAWLCLSGRGDHESWSRCYGLVCACGVAYHISLSSRLLCALRWYRTRLLLHLEWRLLGEFSVMWGTALIAFGILDIIALTFFPNTSANMGAIIVHVGLTTEAVSVDRTWWHAMILGGTVTISMGMWLMRRRPPYMPVGLHAWLASMGEEASTAASIASTIGGRDIHAVMRMAKLRCRSVALDYVTKETMMSNAPMDMDTFKHCGLPTLLGDIDVFLSHSWHDDADAKWEAMQCWRASFMKLHGREPRCWIDKYCIDQTNIAQDLMCLPIYLAGSQRLLILQGPTYLNRLWCIMELLVFVLMGGEIGSVTIRTVETQGFDPAEAIELFSVANATCMVEDDKEMLFSIVEAGFEDFKRFDEVILKMMRSLLLTSKA